MKRLTGLRKRRLHLLGMKDWGAVVETVVRGREIVGIEGIEEILGIVGNDLS